MTSPMDIISQFDLNDNNIRDCIYLCPNRFGPEKLSSLALSSDVFHENELLIYPLKLLTNLYFTSSKLDKLAEHRHNILDADNKLISLSNCTFYICIGTNVAYNTKIIPASYSTETNKIHLPNEQLNFETLLLHFFNEMFEGNEEDKLLQSLNKSSNICISIFARSTGTSKNDPKPFIKDNIIAAATFEFDNHHPILLSWLGVIKSRIEELKINKYFNNIGKQTFHHNYKLGTFLLITIQVQSDRKSVV